MNSQLYSSNARGKYILKNTSWQKLCPSCENMHLSQLPEVDSILLFIYPLQT